MEDFLDTIEKQPGQHHEELEEQSEEVKQELIKEQEAAALAKKNQE